MSGQTPLLRIGMTCAVIVVGSAIIGSQLSTGNLPQMTPTVADEEDAGTHEDDAHASPGGSEDQTVAAEEIHEESGAEDSEELAEVTDEDSAEEPFFNEGETAPEGQASDPAAGESTEEGSDDGEDSWIIGPSSDF